jgi:trehalose/maltose transport system permease protein
MAGASDLRDRRAIWLFLAPMLVVLATVAAWPLARTLFYSVTNASLIDMSIYDFVGFDNFIAYDNGRWYGVLTDPQWLRALRNTLLFAFVSVSIETVLGVVIALVVNANLPGRGLMRAAMLVPWAIPTVVSAKIWAWMLNDQFGAINHLLMGAGLIDAPMAWLGGSGLAMASIVMVDVWKTTPFVALLVLAALQTLPRDCYEAAAVDGIHPVRLFFRVTLPLIRPALAVAVIFRLLDAMRMFDLVYVMTGSNSETMTLSVYARQQLVSFQDVGYGSAASTTLFCIIVLVTALYVALLKPLGRERAS